MASFILLSYGPMSDVYDVSAIRFVSYVCLFTLFNFATVHVMTFYHNIYVPFHAFLVALQISSFYPL